ncbi:hypothetical protein HMPREF9477_00259 [Lachnospiraceae bacterium 2_1_46FAA]|nr:hypothetical protein HMPREF9477_00259 [Lachnospiraceae bacterium 2_1_46FAA]
MMKLLLLTGIILAKVLIAKGVALVFIILSFIFKGKQLHKSTLEWDKYFLSLTDTFVDKYAKIIYIISTVLSSYVMFLLFKFFDFQYPTSLTLIILAVCSLISWYRYHKNGKSYIKSRVYEIKESIKSENVSNNVTP